MRSRQLPIVAFAAMLAVFVIGLFAIFDLRFRSGDVYSPYSTLRADPLGAKILFDSLSQQPGVSVARNLRPMENLRAAGTTVFLLGLSNGFELMQGKLVDKLTVSGARVVLAYEPVWPEGDESAIPPGGTPNQSKKASDKKKEDDPLKLEYDLRKQAAFNIRVKRDVKAADAARAQALGIPRISALYFDQLGPQWTVYKTIDGHPSLAERLFNKGSLVLISQSWMLSNEALAAKPDATSIALLTGPNHRIIFDETHLGVEDSGSVAGLIRRYRLQGFVLALLAISALFVWKNSSSLLDRLPTPAISDAVAGRSSAAGLQNLLQRSVDAKSLVRVCTSEWLASNTRRLSTDARRIFEESARPLALAADPVQSYEAIRRVVDQTLYPWKRRSTD